MDNVAQFALVTLTSLLFTVDPIAGVPAYLVITRGETPTEERRTAIRACIAKTVLLIVFAATGNMIFRAFGITLGDYGDSFLSRITLRRTRPNQAGEDGNPSVD